MLRIRIGSPQKRAIPAGGQGRPPLRRKIETQYNSAPGENPRQGAAAPFLVVLRGLQRGKSKSPFAVFLFTASGLFLCRAKEKGAERLFVGWDVKRKSCVLNVQIHDVFCVFLDEFLARLDGLAHQNGEDLVGRHGILKRDAAERTGRGKHRAAVSGRQLCFVRFYTSSNASKMRNAVGRAMSCRKRAGSTHVNRGAASAHSM